MFETILTGVLVFVIGQMILKLVVEPVHLLKVAFGDVSQSLRINAPFVFNLDRLEDVQKRELQQELLRLSGLVESRVMVVPLYWFWSRIFFLPTPKELQEVHQNFTTMANYVISGPGIRVEIFTKNLQELCESLGIYIPENSKIDPDLLDQMIKSYFSGGRA